MPVVQRHLNAHCQNYISSEELTHIKSKKKLTLTGAARFNTKPKTGLAFLEENGLIYHDLSPEVSRPLSLAMFLKSCTRLDKKLLGDFISRPENIDVLKAFIGLFEFRGVSFYPYSRMCMVLTTFSIETHRGCYAGAVGVLPAAGRGPADRSHNRNVRRNLFCFRTRYVFNIYHGLGS